MDIPIAYKTMDMPAETNGGRKVINILFIGESGIGKTTCINSIPHYLGNKNLNQAFKKPLEVLIPTHFTYNVKDENGEWQSKEIKIGESDNENFKAGESHTLKPRAYCFEYKEYLIRIIDTPGISDSRGYFQDKENLQEIITFISELTHLNLIVFLLHPDKPVLSENFEFVFKELIMQFHRNAAENIVFGFTRSFSCGFEVGQSLDALKELLGEIKEKQRIDIRVNDKTSYPFDNVAFRYLCMKKDGQKDLFKPKEVHSFEACFKNSRKELIRLIEYAVSVKPHDPKYTAMLNYIRNVILRLAGPMAMIATSAQKTLQLIHKQEIDIQKYEDEEAELLKKKFRYITIVRYRMERRQRTFCRNCAILKIYCDDDRLPYIEADPELADHNPLELYECDDALVNDDGEYYCPECGPDFKKAFSNKVFHQFKEEVAEEDETVKSRLDGVKKSCDVVAALLESHRKVAAELEEERETIIKGCAKFAVYLKTSSIVSYNDATENYLNVLIDLEEKKNGVTSVYYKNLQKMKKEYEEEKRLIDENLGNASLSSNTSITPEEVNILIEDLVKLKRYGKDIRAAFTVVKEDDGTVDDANRGGKKFSIVQTPSFLHKLISKFKK